MRKEYLDKLIKMLPDAGMDAMLISPSEELKFFSGFTPTMCERFQGLFVKADGSVFYVCNLIYADEVRQALADVPVYAWFDGDGMVEPVGAILREQGLAGKTVGVNSSAQAFNVLDIARETGIIFVNGKPLLEEVRIVKSADELQRLREAADIANAAFDPVCGFIQPGITEGDIRDFLFAEMSKRGGYNMWAIVASGPNSSFPHYNGYDRVLQQGDCIVLDWGCEYKEMQSDISRTVFLAPISDELRELYQLSLRATMTAESLVKEGAYVPDIDAAARAVLDEKGLAHTLTSRTGHGIGYMMHEAPDIKASNKRKLERGMCFSIEPGIYLAGRFGMRVEDIVAVNLEGETEILNKASRELRVL